MLGVVAALAAPSVLEARKAGSEACSLGGRSYTVVRDAETGEERWIDVELKWWPVEFVWFPITNYIVWR
ncbi:MAG TPA: hypothetical protein VFF73_05855 [Planctomycetota bacterium]|nr:hypothetical protein [Planctomycetota bacterium]